MFREGQLWQSWAKTHIRKHCMRAWPNELPSRRGLLMMAAAAGVSLATPRSARRVRNIGCRSEAHGRHVFHARRAHAPDEYYVIESSNPVRWIR
jgi:hypothetical protein